MYKHILKKATVVGIILLSIAFSCENKPCCEDGKIGVIKDYSGLDGCTFIVELESGDKLQVLNLDSFGVKIEDGNEITISYHETEGMSGICMAGKMVEADCICDE